MKTILYSQVVFVALSARISRILLRFVWNWSAIFPKVTLPHLGVPKIKKVCKSFLTLEGWNQTPLNVICFTLKSGLEDTSLPKKWWIHPNHMHHKHVLFCWKLLIQFWNNLPNFPALGAKLRLSRPSVPVVPNGALGLFCQRPPGRWARHGGDHRWELCRDNPPDPFQDEAPKGWRCWNGLVC